ncbi:bifunctional homocysteine S-methyltransferase/methylenetetrahydrofolate reductase, partial [Myxococcota bacterium]|nr:bifunctional homocysteine S-methyltransferase/methylenetetrahydrofolate reductase [Myxococcota bacterium]
ADALLIETVTYPQELRMAIEGARAGSTLPIVAQVKAVEEGAIIDGSDPLDLAKKMHQWGADVVGANCNGPEEIFRVVSRMVESGLPISAFANAGRARNIEDRLIYLATPEHMGVYARRMYKAGIKLVGGCCGTNPMHIRRVSAAARMVVPKSPVQHKIPSGNIHLRERSTVQQRSALGKKIGQKFIFSVEVNPDKGLSTKAPIAAAKMLKEAGADVINIADGPRASVRMGNLALALEMQKVVDIDVLLHFVTRDKNLLGLQASILGAHVLGMRNLVVVTGDPPKLGDYPDATAVYDLDSVELLKLIDGLNRGVDPAGRAFDPPTSFVLATGCEPAAKDWERERLRLAQKVEAGADFVMTQPVFDENILERFLDEAERLNLPVLLGLLPLASHRNAEFLHKEVPGMQLPDTIREQMRKAGKGKDARKVGVELALQSLSKVRSRVA